MVFEFCRGYKVATDLFLSKEITPRSLDDLEISGLSVVKGHFTRGYMTALNLLKITIELMKEEVRSDDDMDDDTCRGAHHYYEQWGGKLDGIAKAINIGIAGE